MTHQIYFVIPVILFVLATGGYSIYLGTAARKWNRARRKEFDRSISCSTCGASRDKWHDSAELEGATGNYCKECGNVKGTFEGEL